MPESKELPVFVEFESKYLISNGELLWEFKHLVESKLGQKDFVYVQSADVYYERSLNDFVRYRFSQVYKRAELTTKRKINSNNNIIREEVNMRVDGNDFETVEKLVNSMGYVFNFKIDKQCHIYKTEDATLVFYSVRDLENQKLSHFIEIEVIEGVKFTEEESWAIIRKYETMLAPLGVTAQKRLRKSLYEMYRKGV
jgi:predicted adenylyl cyclase CyaB